jgi:protein ImuB
VEEEGARPVAVGAEGRILCADAAARAEGVRPGATLAEAIAACGRLVVVPADPAADAAALRALAEALLGLAPAVELAGPDGLLLDASAAHLLAPRGAGAPLRAGEERLARRALAVAEEMGYAACAAVATGRGPARALAAHLPVGPGSGAPPRQRAPGADLLHGEDGARGEGPVSWVPPDGAAAALAALPVSALGLGPEIAARLAALGVDCAGTLASLPEGTLAHRFGPAGVLAARLARGEDGSPLVPYVPRTLPEETLDLEAPAEAADPILFGLKRLADRVAARLAGRGLGATRLRVVLKLDTRGEERLDVPLAAASAAPARWLLPVKEHLFSLRLPAAVVALRLAALEVAAIAPEQLAMGDRPEALAALEGVLARLAVRLGDGALFAAEPVDRHRPEGAYRAVPFRAGPRRHGGVDAPRAAPEEARARPTRLLAVPEPVVAEGEGGRLTALRVAGRARAVLALEGPERLRGEWWAGSLPAARAVPAAEPRSASGAPWGAEPRSALDAPWGTGPFDRDYYRVRLEGLGDCWVFRDGRGGRLWLHGFFD